MQLLFVTNSIPFPAREGVELPLQKFISYFSSIHQLDLLVLVQTEQAMEDFYTRKANLPTTVRHAHVLKCKRQVKAARVCKEISGISPAFLSDKFDPVEIRKRFSGLHYNFAWISPIGCIGFINYCRQLSINLVDYVAIGLNDATSSLYLDDFKQILKGHTKREVKKVFRGMRLPFIVFHERRLLQSADLIHVQTPIEKAKSARILGRSAPHVRIIDVPNGRKEELEAVNYGGVDTMQVLFMTNLSGARRNEYWWFIQKVWPLVSKAVPNASLMLIGPPPEKHSLIWTSLPENVKIAGYMDKLEDVFNSVAVAVIPTTHGTGLINRLVDAVVAGVPVVACSEPLKTVPDLEIGEQALKGDSQREFADNIIRLLRDRELRLHISTKAKSLGMSLPTWHDSAKKIEDAMLSLTKRGY